jgi:hypothetical protein
MQSPVEEMLGAGNHDHRQFLRCSPVQAKARDPRSGIDQRRLEA